MKVLRAVWAEVLGLFVDDGSLAAAILVLVGLVATLRGRGLIGPAVGGGLLFGGLVVILLENIRRSTRR
ncbi:MAG: hypothetical protein KGK10_07265 [Rhodospirillales bacterium]|nr:hypothetical protein [Rhodospirillales bacterium]